jgi:hypothetical protein
MHQALAVILSLCLGLFLADAVVSLLDDSLILLTGGSLVSGLRGIVGLLTGAMSLALYLLIGLTPKVPKRIFLPVALFPPAAALALFPCAIYCFDHLPWIAWGISAGQLWLGWKLLFLTRSDSRFHWPLVRIARVNKRWFGWLNLAGFAVINLFLVLPGIGVYLFVCSAGAVTHFSDGFMALHPDGFSVQVRKYMRNDGKTIELFPMAHVADAGFYQRVERTFPTNSIVLMEGVTDSRNLLTNKISYARMAKTLGLAEQHKSFVPTRGKIVRADVDVDQFSADTIQLLNLVMLIHANGVTPANVVKLMAYSPSPKIQEELMNDLLRHRNQNLLAEIQSHLPQTDNIMVPWGVAHMPGISRAIQEMGFRVVDTENYEVIRFWGNRQPGREADKP